MRRARLPVSGGCASQKTHGGDDEAHEGGEDAPGVAVAASVSEVKSTQRSAKQLPWLPGMRCDAQDCKGSWLSAEVLKVRRLGGQALYLVHFAGFTSEWDEWLDATRLSSCRSSAALNLKLAGEATIAGVPCARQEAAKRPADIAKIAGVRCYLDQYKQMLAWVASSPTQEIGGDLFGRWRSDGFPEVVYVLGPGPMARGTRVSFFQDEAFLEANGAALGALGLEHIGEWHSHHTLNLPTPSDGDCRTVKGAMRDYNRDQFVLAIGTVSPSGDGRSHAIPYLFSTSASAEKPYVRLAWDLECDMPSPHAQFRCADGKHDSFVAAAVPAAAAADSSPVSSSSSFSVVVAPRSSHFASAHLPKAKRHARASAKTLKAPASAPRQWYADAEGQALLKRIFAECEAALGEIKMSREVFSQNIEFAFRDFSLAFPADFPQTHAKLATRDQPFGAPLASAAATTFTEVCYRVARGSFRVSQFLTRVSSAVSVLERQSHATATMPKTTS